MPERNQSTPLRAATIEPRSRPRRGDGEDADDERDGEDEDGERDDADDLDEESRRSFGVGALSTSAWDRTRGTSTAPPRDARDEDEEPPPDTQRQSTPAPDGDWDAPTIPDLEPFQSPEEQK